MACILIVDDRATNRRYLAQVLGSQGHHVVEAADGAEALAQVHDHRPALVITDLQMPVMDGFELTRRLRADPATEAMKVVFYTATYRNADARRLAESCGVSEVLYKPTGPRVLLDTVHRVLGGEPARIEPEPALPDAADASASPLASLGQRLMGYIGHTNGSPLLPDAQVRVQRSASRVFALLELALDLALEREMRVFLRMVCEAGCRIVDAEMSALVLLSDDERDVRLVQAHGFAPDSLRNLGVARLLDGLPGRVWRSEGAVREGDGDAVLRGLPADFGAVRSFVGVPIAGASGRCGLLMFADTRSGRRFDEEDEMMALGLAAAFAVMFELFDANEALRRRAAELQLEITQRQQAERATREALQSLEHSRLELASFSQRLLEQEKQTTRRLAQALHDELGQTIAAMRLSIDAFNAPASSATSRAGLMHRLDRLVVTANRQVREVLVDLRPPLLDEHGLAAALDNELRERAAMSDEVALRLQVCPPAQCLRWPSEVEYAAFMIARESVHNALRHASAGTVRVMLDGEAGRLALTVADDGRGLPAGGAESAPGHLGMVGMRERALAISGRLDVRSPPGHGTTVQLHWNEAAA